MSASGGRFAAAACAWLVVLLVAAAPASAAFGFLTQFGGGQRQMNKPKGVGTDAAGNVYVADSVNDRIQKFSPSGSFLTQWGSRGSGDGKFFTPYDAAVDSAGNVYVADLEGNRIQKFDPSGAFVTKWGSSGTGDGQFRFPLGVAIDSADNVYVVDGVNHRVQKFSSSGAFITKWGSFGDAAGQFKEPHGIAISAAGTVYVADYDNHRIQRFDSSGAFLSSWGSLGTSDGQFDNPRGVATDSAGDVYVADRDNRRIQKFSSTGAFIAKWGGPGSGDGQFAAPIDLATDPAGNVYVAERDNHRIQKFTSSGGFLTKWGTFGRGDGQFERPLGVSADAVRNLYVADTNDHRVQTLTYGGTFVRKWGAEGSATGQFKLPQSTATESSFGNVYVADTQNHRVQEFAPSGFLITSWGGLGTGNGQFNRPGGIAVDPSSRDVYVADSFNHRIQRFSSSGAFISAFGSFGSGSSQFDSPQGIAIDGTGIYVADTGNHRIQKLDRFGLFLTAWGGLGTGDGQLNSPQAVATEPAGGVYVSDTGNDRIQKFDSTGGFLSKFGSAGAGSGQFNSPRGLTTDPGGNVYVADSGNHLVQAFADLGQIVVVKDAIPDDPQDFDFTAGGGLSPTSFKLDDDADPTLPNSRTFTGVVPGAGYSISETVPPAWNQVGATCDDGSPVSNINVGQGETVTCTFTNNRPGGTIIIKKDAVPDASQDFDFMAGGGLTPNRFLLDDDSDPALSNTKVFNQVPAGGGYSVAEATPPPSWTPTTATCDDGSPISNINVSEGETVTCTFTNASGKIVVRKDAQPDDSQDFSFSAGGGLTPAGFNLDDDSNPTLSNTRTFEGVAPGSGYSISEVVPSGWGQAAATCDDGSPVSSIDVSLGETVTCTFTNRPNRIVVVKDSFPNDPQDFEFNAGGGLTPTTFKLDDDSDPTLSNSRAFEKIPAGSGYNLEELLPPGWDQVIATCDDGSPISNISVSGGETVTCTFTNEKRGRIVVVKDARPDDPQDFVFSAGGGLVPTSFTLDDDSDPTRFNAKTFSHVPVGSGYSVSETVPSGWEQLSASCDDGSPISNIDVGRAETVTCTFVNQLLAGAGAISGSSFARPIGATENRVTLVPAHTECTSPDSTHGSPPNKDSCRSTALSTDNLTVPSDDSTLHNASTTFRFHCTNGGTPPSCGAPGDQADAQIISSADDVRCASTASGATPCGAANTTPGSDYSGVLLLELPLRITDRYNGPSTDIAATLTDAEFTSGLPCTATSGDLSKGSTCSLNTSTDALVPGFAREAQRALLALGQVQILDAGDNGTLAAGTIAGSGGTCPPQCKGNGDEQAFLRQGIFVP